MLGERATGMQHKIQLVYRETHVCFNYLLCIIMEKSKSTIKEQLCREIGVAMEVSKVKSRIEARIRSGTFHHGQGGLGAESPWAQT